MQLKLQSTLCTLLLGFILLTFSCKRDLIEPEEPVDQTIVQNVAEHLDFFEESAEIDARLELINEPIILGDTTLGRSECTDYAAWSRVAEVTTLKLQGQNLSTTHVAMTGNLAMVSYHMRGSTHYGAVEVIDLSNPSNPKIKSQAFFNRADVNAIAVEQNPTSNETRIWVALSDSKDGAVLGELKIKNKRFQNYYRVAKLTYELGGGVSSSANYIAEAGDFLYVTAGRSNGGVFCLNKETLVVTGFKEYPHGKGVATNGTVSNEATVAAVQSYENPRIFTDLVSGSSFSNSFPIDAITHQVVEDELGGKISVAFTGEGSSYLVMTMGKFGVKGYDVNTGIEVFTSPEDMLTGGNSNGISVDDNYMYVANGADGLAVFPLDENGLPDPNSTFLWDLDEPEASANYVSSNGEWVFVAKGEGGFKILKTPNPGDCLPICGNDADGVPSCLSGQSAVCETLAAKIALTLPLGSEAQNLHPEFFNTKASEILLKEDSKIELTFIEENTSLKNSVGYYFYSDECPPASPSELIGLISFPNYSASGSDGGLVQGNTIKLPGNFKAGTKIGFFFLRNGWNGGHQIYYTNGDFNSNPNRQGLLLYDSKCDALIGAFQGNPLPSNDADFRDMVFEIKFTTPNAIDGSEYNQL